METVAKTITSFISLFSFAEERVLMFFFNFRCFLFVNNGLTGFRIYKLTFTRLKLFELCYSLMPRN